jgi:putative ABC transport system substrate-binding protein
MRPFTAALVAAALAVTAGAAARAEQTVAIASIVEHPALDAVYKGIADQLKEAPPKGGAPKIDFANAQGNQGTAVQIARKYVGENPAVMVAIATPIAQSMASATKDIPIVFAAVTDPLAAKLVKSNEAPGGNVTGVSDLSPIDKHLQLIHRAMPNAKRLGVVYNPGETNSVALVDRIKALGPKMGFSIVEAPAAKSSDVIQSGRSLVGKADAIYVPTDNTVVSAFEGLVKVGEEAKLPVFAGDTDTVKRGAVAAVGFDYYALGRQAGRMVARVLDGAKPATIPVETVQETQLYVNPGAAEKMGLKLPQELVAEAKEVVGK